MRPDTNIVASATWRRGKPAHCVEGWVLGKYEVAASHSMLNEYEEVMARLAVRHPNKQPTDWLTAIRLLDVNSDERLKLRQDLRILGMF